MSAEWGNIETFHTFVQTLLYFAEAAEYMGVYFYMLLVGTFIPVPSEILLIPAGYLAATGERNFTTLLLCGALGSLSGALINYLLARYIVHRFLGHKPIVRKVTTFFRRHGNISVFLAPLTPGMGQYISLPAGLSHMPLVRFLPLTFAANLIWVGFMLLIGYIFGEGEDARQNAARLSLILLGFVILSASLYVWRQLHSASDVSKKEQKMLEDEVDGTK